MRRLAYLVLLALASCATDQTTKIPDPDFALVQISKMPGAATHVTGAFPVQYRLHVGNHATIPITLKRVTVQSVGMGAYDVPSATRPFDVKIAPEQSTEVDFWVPAVVTDPTILGANGPVTLHGVIVFNSEWGPFQRTFMLQVNERAAGQ